MHSIWLDFLRKVENDEVTIEEEDIKTVMMNLLKDTILQLLKNTAPKAYKYRFNDEVVKRIAECYLRGESRAFVDKIFYGENIEDIPTSSSEEEEEIDPNYC